MSSYQHQFLDGRACALPVGKAVCVGRNYAAHVREGVIAADGPTKELLGPSGPAAVAAYAGDSRR